MARLITKFKYLKPNGRKGIGGYAKYIATREGVERIDESFKLSPASGKQKGLIKKILRDFPDAKDMHEYEDYLTTPNMGNASEFITRALEDNAQSVTGRKTYADYIATRPRAERFGSHGLFTDDGVEVKLEQVSEELNRHQGNVWTVILSLRREDAQRLGYDTGKRWRDMLRTQTEALASNLKIPMNNLHWYAAFHNESHHPHVHLIAYSVIENEGYLTEQGVHNLRSSFARDIFAQDLLCVYEKQTEYRDRLREQSKYLIAEIVRRINEEGYENPQLEEKLLQLAKRLSKTKGKKQYGYLKADVKALVCSIVDEIARDERIAMLYDLWYEQREEVIKTYTQELPERVSLSQNAEFKSVRNAVVREAVNLITEREPSDQETEKNIDDEEPTEQEIERSIYRGRKSKKTMWELYAWAKEIISDEGYDAKLAIGLLMESAHRGNTIAKYRLGKMLLQGDGVKKDIPFAVRWLEDAVQDGNEYAEYLLGKTLLSGEELDRDVRRAQELLSRSAERGNKYAAFLLGRELLEGKILEQDIAAAVRLLKISADKEYPPAQYALGKLYYRGVGIEKNEIKALEYLGKAAEKDPNALYLAGKIFLTEESVKDIKKAIRYFESAAEQGNDFAEFQLGRIYLYGTDMPRDEEKALAYLNAAASHGNEYAQQLLQRIEEDREQFMSEWTKYAVSVGVARLFGNIARILQEKADESGKIGLTDRKLWRQIEEKKEAQGLKHG